MATLNTVSAAGLSGAEIPCACGAVHKIKSEIIASCGAVNGLPDLIKRLISPSIKVALVCDAAGYAAAGERVAAALENAGFRVAPLIYGKIAPDIGDAARFDALDEDVRLYVSVGGGAAADLVKFMSAQKKLPCVLVASTPSLLGFLSPSAYIRQNKFREIYRAEPPAAVVCDYDLAAACPPVFWAAAYGEILSRLTAVFDWEFASVLTREYCCKDITEQAYAAVDTVLRASESILRRDKHAAALICECGLRLSALTQMCGNSRLNCGGETHFSHALEMLFTHESRPLKMYGENAFLSACIVAKSYRAALSYRGAGFMPPPDNILRSEKIAEYFGVDERLSLSKVQPYLNERMFTLRGYIFNEFRGDFLDKISRCEATLDKARRYFKRLYDDAGYGIDGYLSESDADICLALAPDVREKFTLLTHMKHIGILDFYIT